jgi:anti-anti-sigma factor
VDETLLPVRDVAYRRRRSEEVFPVSEPLVIAPSGPCRYALRGELSVETGPQLEDHLGTLPPETSVVLDLSRVTFMDTVGLAAITRSAERLDAMVILEAPQPPVTRFLEATETAWRTRAIVRHRASRGSRSAAVRHASTAPRRDPVLDWS